METNSSKTSPWWKSSNCLNRVSEIVIRWRLRNMNHQILGSYCVQRAGLMSCMTETRNTYKFVKCYGKGLVGRRALDGKIGPMSGSVLVKMIVTVWVMRFRFVTVCTFGFHSNKGYRRHANWYRLPCHGDAWWAAGSKHENVHFFSMSITADQICKCSSPFNCDITCQKHSVHKKIGKNNRRHCCNVAVGIRIYFQLFTLHHAVCARKAQQFPRISKLLMMAEKAEICSAVTNFKRI
jgi:hypothetical protein